MARDLFAEFGIEVKPTQAAQNAPRDLFAEFGIKAEPAKKQAGGFIDGPGNPYVESVLQGATFGHSDEIQAGMKSAYDYAKAKLSGQPAEYGALYDRNVGAIRQNLAQMSQDNPVLSAALNIGGGIATGVGALKGAGVAARPLQRALQAGSTGGLGAKTVGLAGAGAGLGAVSGIGHSEATDTKELAADAAKGALLGAATGVAAPVVLGAGKAAVKQATKSVSHLFASDKTLANRKVLEALSRNNMSVDDAVAELRRLGPQGMLADLGDNMTDLADTVARRPGESRAIATQALTQRQTGQHERITSAMKQYLGADDDFYRSLDDLVKLRETQASPIYKEVVKPDVNLPEDAATKLIADDPRVGALIQEVKKDQWFGWEPFPDGPVKSIAELPDTSMVVWHQAKQLLDDRISAARRAGENMRASQMMDVKRKVLGLMDEAQPQYAAARRIWAGSKAAEDALQAGRKAMNGDAELIAKQVRAMPESEREFFVAGAFRALRDKVLSSPDTADAYKRVFNTEASRQRIQSLLRATMDDDRAKQAFDALEQTMKAESQMYKSMGILGGSQTAPRQAASADLLRDPGMWMDVATGNLRGAAVAGARKFLRPSDISPQVNAELGRTLFAQGPQAQAAILGAVQGRPMQQFIQRAQPTAEQIELALRGSLAGYAGGR